jgi:PAS domain S-box-containing protein
MGDGVIVLDAQNRIVDFNPAAQQIIGQPSAAIMGRLAGQVLTARADLVERYRDVLEASSEIVLGEGETRRYFDLRISPLYDRHNRLSGRLIVLRDVTERRQAEEALRQSEQHFRQVVASISDHIYMTEVTSDGRHINLYLSPHVEILTGYALEKFVNDWSFWPMVVIHPDDQAAAAAQAARLAQGEDSQLEYRLIRANGEIIWVRDSGRAEKDAIRQSILVYGVVSDITGRKQAEAELAQARDQALEASRLKTELLAKVSHELRTPLGAILGFAELLELGVYDSLSEKQKPVVSEIIDSTHDLTCLVNDLLDQAKLDAGKLELNPISFAPADLLNDTLAKMEALAHSKGLSLTAHSATDIPPVLRGDLVRLQQILVDLISNAIKFTQMGTVQVRLCRPDVSHWAMQVADTGIGIPYEAQARIFEPFGQVDGSATREHAGTGLGLSLVKQLANLMGGEVTLESEIGRGSIFTVLLPLQPVQEEVI